MSAVYEMNPKDYEYLQTLPGNLKCSECTIRCYLFPLVFRCADSHCFSPSLVFLQLIVEKLGLIGGLQSWEFFFASNAVAFIGRSKKPAHKGRASFSCISMLDISCHSTLIFLYTYMHGLLECSFTEVLAHIFPLYDPC